MQKAMAERLLRGDGQAMIEVFRSLQPFAAISDLAAKFTVSATGGRNMSADIKVLGQEIVPRQAVTMLKTGNVSVREMSKTSYQNVYRDYVCGLVLRVARELFAILPLDSVLVTAVEALLNKQTGNLEDQAIVSVFIPRQSWVKLNLAAVDPFECLRNFTHTVDFRSNAGFSPVQRVKLQLPSGK